jgi:hypothetical protein
VSLNILNGGFTDRRIQYDSRNLPIGPLFEYLKTDVAPFHDVVALQELNGWTDNDMRRVSEALGYRDYYLCKNCNRYKVGFMTRDTLETLVDISTAGSGAIAIRTGGVVYATLHLSAASGTGRTEFCCGTQGWTHRQEPQAAIAPDRDTRRADPSSSSPPAILQSYNRVAQRTSLAITHECRHADQQH